MFPPDLIKDAEQLLDKLREQGMTLATAESCTGGLIAGLLTEIPGASEVLCSGFVTYSNAAKTSMLGVDEDLIERHGAVSEEVARAMAGGALKSSTADIAVAVTGIAGPAGGTKEKPVGLVHLCAARKDGIVSHQEQRYGSLGRSEIRLASVRDAIGLIEAVRTAGIPAT